MSIVIFVIILLILVLVHEFGHFFTAKKFGIRVDEFGFGFPPKIFGKKYGETEYSLNLLPIGGFVKIFGENGIDDESVKVGPAQESEYPTFTTEDISRSFTHKAKWKQALVLFAGIFANFLLAWILFSVGFMSGLPTSVGSEPAGYKLANVHLVVVSVVPKSPADIAGLKSGDAIVSIGIGKNSTTYISPATVQSFVVGSEGKEVNISYTRGKDIQIKNTALIPIKNVINNKLEIGISMDQVGTVKLPFFIALKEGMVLDWFVTKSTIVGLYTLIIDGLHGKGSFASVTGPVGMVSIVGDAYKFGFVYLLSFTALISVNLAVINLIPFPALDGGRLLFLLIEKIKGSRINPKISNTLNMIGFGLLILLMVVITYHDIVKLF